MQLCRRRFPVALSPATRTHAFLTDLAGLLQLRMLESVTHTRVGAGTCVDAEHVLAVH